MRPRPALLALALGIPLAQAACNTSLPPPVTSTTRGSVATSTTTSASKFVPIIETEGPESGRAATSEAVPASCTSPETTFGIENCMAIQTDNTDAKIDEVQAARFARATPAGRAAILSGDSAWLAARAPVCRLAFHTGGTIDGISIAGCLLDESTARLDAVKGTTPAVQMLSSTDNPDPDEVSWYTAPDGTRIGELDTQGDQTGGAIIAWMVIAGPDGYVLHPDQFSFADGAFVDRGIVQSPDPTGKRLATAHEYTFGIDYSRLSSDPNEAKRTGGYTYSVNGTPVAVWK
ncbi:MAG: lysozyme inhibitor LprI family protein [Acidimicrobiales bacterium]